MEILAFLPLAHEDVLGEVPVLLLQFAALLWFQACHILQWHEEGLDYFILANVVIQIRVCCVLVFGAGGCENGGSGYGGRGFREFGSNR